MSKSRQFVPRSRSRKLLHFFKKFRPWNASKGLGWNRSSLPSVIGYFFLKNFCNFYKLNNFNWFLSGSLVDGLNECPMESQIRFRTRESSGRTFVATTGKLYRIGYTYMATIRTPVLLGCSSPTTPIHS